jgi:phosphohistidine swiveling domain-containing protein
MVNIESLTFSAPGGGIWTVDGVHTPKPQTPISGSTYCRGITRGSHLGFAEYGSPLEAFTPALVNRFVYLQISSMIARPPGPDDVARPQLEAMIAATPRYQERLALCEEVMASKRWRTNLEHWDSVGRPWLMGRTLTLTDVVPSDLADADLAQHLTDCAFQLERSMEYHHVLNLTAFIPLGRYLLATNEWTGIEPQRLIDLMIGSSAISAGDEPELRALTAAFSADPGAAALLTGGRATAGDRLNSLRTRDGEVGRAAQAYVRITGYRTIAGWEAMEPFALEEPDGILLTINGALNRTRPSLDLALRDEIRTQVPSNHRDEFDELLDEARSFSRLRDERDLYCNMPAGGLVRRAAMEIGRRLMERGVLPNPEHATELSLVEARQILIDGQGVGDAPSASELQDRYEFRQRYSIADIPPTLGEGDELPVPPEWLPEAAQRLGQAWDIQLGLAFGAPASATDEFFTGQPASPGQYEGPVRLILSPDDFAKIEEGDVLVTTSTNPAFVVLLPKVGALVTEHGGILSHAGIIAREFGLPAVVGCTGVTAGLVDGQRVRVDADAGVVTLVN